MARDTAFGIEVGHGGSGPGYDVHVSHFPEFRSPRGSLTVAAACNADSPPGASWPLIDVVREVVAESASANETS